jgi:hypothetical protein
VPDQACTLFLTILHLHEKRDLIVPGPELMG